MISATDVSNVLRVSYTVNMGEQRQAEVVCFVRPERGGRLQIYYSHHVWRRRTTPTSKWEDETTMRIPFTPQLESEIRVAVPYELWTTLAKDVRVMPGDIHAKVSTVLI